MKIYIIRHAEPDYSIDSLTPKGWREAELLGRRLSKIQPAQYYVSPLGRAKDTASFTLNAVGARAEECPWLREFDSGYGYTMPPESGYSIAWDICPGDWVDDGRYYDPAHWHEGPLYRGSGVDAACRIVYDGLDALLARHGYVREARHYRVEKANTDNLLLFCHFGVECVMLSRLLGCPPMLLWHHTVALPSSVTVLATEEREEGTAVFRMSRFGDLSHLDAAGEEPSFAARFCETFDRTEQRH